MAEIGFKDAAQWTIVDDRKIQVSVDDDKEWQNCKEAKNALYAFYVGAEVMYVGKTARTLEKRFLGYTDPGKTQATNRKCHDEIRKQLKAQDDRPNHGISRYDASSLGRFSHQLSSGLGRLAYRILKAKA